MAFSKSDIDDGIFERRQGDASISVPSCFQQQPPPVKYGYRKLRRDRITPGKQSKVTQPVFGYAMLEIHQSECFHNCSKRFYVNVGFMVEISSYVNIPTKESQSGHFISTPCRRSDGFSKSSRNF